MSLSQSFIFKCLYVTVMWQLRTICFVTASYFVTASDWHLKSDIIQTTPHSFFLRWQTVFSWISRESSVSSSLCFSYSKLIFAYFMPLYPQSLVQISIWFSELLNIPFFFLFWCLLLLLKYQPQQGVTGWSMWICYLQSKTISHLKH